MGLVDQSQRILLKGLARHDKRSFNQYLKEREQTLSAEIDKLLINAVSKGQILSYEQGILKEVGQELGLNTLRKVLSTMPEKVSYSALLKEGTLLDRSRWGLKEYRKFAPMELQNNPELYAELMERDRERKELAANISEDIIPGRDLDHYRRNNPNYLAEHPDEYERLLKQKQSKK